MSFSVEIEKQQREIESILKERIELTQKERANLRDAASSLDGKIKAALGQIAAAGGASRGRESIEDITASITEMEFAHATTSQSKAQERDFLKNLDKLRQKKKTLLATNQIQSEIDELKAKRTSMSNELKEKDDRLEELYLGLRRVRTALSLRVAINDIINETYSVPEEKLPMVIGKGGASLRQIENDHGVSIETSRAGGGELSILGTPAAIVDALAVINNIVDTIVDEFPLSEAAIACLVHEKGTLVQDIQTRNNVRVEINRSKNICKLLGLTDAVRSAKREIQEMKAVKRDLVVDSALLPHIVGKGGSTIRSIGEDNHVRIDILREENKIVVLGLVDGVDKAIETIKAVIDDNKEIEEILKIPKQIMIGCVIGANGQTIRNVQITYNVNLRTEKGADTDTLHIIGTTSRVLAAKLHVLELMSEYSKNSEIVVIPSDCMPIILGKKGVRINALREDNASVNIDVDDDSLRICGGTAEGRMKARKAIEDILAANWSANVPCESDLGILLKSAKGADVRAKLVTNLGLNMDIDTENAVIKLRGYKDNVLQGMNLITEFLGTFYTIFVDLSDEDCASLMNGTAPASNGSVESTNGESIDNLVFSPTKYVEAKFGVEVYINRKECRLRIRGSSEAIESAKASILGVLGGDINHGALLIPIDPLLYATLIGKAGSNLKKMESEWNVKFDIIKSKSLLRIRGTPEHAKAAKVAVIDFMDVVRATVTVNIPSFVPDKDYEKLVDVARALYDAEFVVNPITKMVNIRGPLLLCEDAKIVLDEIFNDKSSYTIKLPSQYVSTRRIEKIWKKFREVHHVKIEVSTVDKHLMIEGRYEAVRSAKGPILQTLSSYLPLSTFKVISLTSSQLKFLSPQRHIRSIQDVAGLEDVVIDRAVCNLRLMSSSPEAVVAATNLTEEKLRLWDDNHVSLAIESFMLPNLVGKSGSSIMALEKSLGITITVNRIGLTLDLESTDKAKLTEATAVVKEKLEKMKSEHFQMELDESTMRLLIGRQGTTITKFRAETEATIDLDYTTRILKITGSVEHVNVTRDKIVHFLSDGKQKNCVQSIHVPVGLIPRLIGVKGGNIREIQQTCDVRIDLDKETERGVIRGTLEACASAVKAIQKYFDDEGVDIRVDVLPQVTPAAPLVEPEVTDIDYPEPEPIKAEQAKLDSGRKLPPGVSPAANKAAMSKSALKRLKKKEKQSEAIVSTSITDSSVETTSAVEVASIDNKDSVKGTVLATQEDSDDEDINSLDFRLKIEVPTPAPIVEAPAPAPVIKSRVLAPTVSQALPMPAYVPVTALPSPAVIPNSGNALPLSGVNTTSSMPFMIPRPPPGIAVPSVESVSSTTAASHAPAIPSLSSSTTDSLLNILLGKTSHEAASTSFTSVKSGPPAASSGQFGIPSEPSKLHQMLPQQQQPSQYHSAPYFSQQHIQPHMPIAQQTFYSPYPGVPAVNYGQVSNDSGFNGYFGDFGPSELQSRGSNYGPPQAIFQSQSGSHPNSGRGIVAPPGLTMQQQQQQQQQQLQQQQTNYFSGPSVGMQGQYQSYEQVSQYQPAGQYRGGQYAQPQQPQQSLQRGYVPSSQGAANMYGKKDGPAEAGVYYRPPGSY